jgi:phage FluMu protein Com
MSDRQLPRNSQPALTVKDNSSLRCCCGSLLARLVPDGVELKCRRCKRQIVVPLDVRTAKRTSM